MKRLFEPISGAIISFFSWAIFSDFFMSMLLAFLGGMVAYFGKWLCSRIIGFCTRNKNAFTSKTRDEQNSYNSPEID